MNARDGTNVSPTVSVTDGAAPIGNAQSTFVITDYGMGHRYNHLQVTQHLMVEQIYKQELIISLR